MKVQFILYLLLTGLFIILGVGVQGKEPYWLSYFLYILATGSFILSIHIGKELCNHRDREEQPLL